MTFFSKEFIAWLDEHAEEIDQHSGGPADELLEKIAKEGVYKLGVPVELGGLGGNRTQAIDAISELAQHSLVAAFISWGHANFIANILHAEHSYIRDTYLADLLTGKIAGATALSNAVKSLSELEELNLTVTEEDRQLYLNGRFPWVTNTRSDRFITISCAGFEDEDRSPLIIAIPSDAENLSRSTDLEFVSLQGSNTAALTFDQVPLKKEWIVSHDAADFISKNRPAFLGYQFALAFGLADRSLAEVKQYLNKRTVLKEEWEEQLAALNTIRSQLYKGLLDEDYFVEHPRELFQLRIDIVDVVAQSLLLELQANGGQCYFRNSSSSFTRRWNEGAFLPIVTPSAVQLRFILENS